MEANAIIAISVVVYLIFLHHEHHFQFKRIFILGMLLLSIVVPFFQWRIQSDTHPAIAYFIEAYTLPEVTITALQNSLTTAESPTSTSSFMLVLTYVYVAILCIYFIIFIIRLGKLVVILKNTPVTFRQGNYMIIESTKPIASFSFFHYVFVGRVHELSQEEKKHIITHELAHASKYHSIDILFIEILRLVFWFNPLVHLLKNILMVIHEYQADQHAVQSYNQENYCQLLAREALVSKNFTLASHFNQSLTLKRIAMIKSVKKKLNVWKLAIVVPVITGSVCMVACQDQAMKEVMATNKTLSQVNESQIPAELQAEVDKIKQKDPNAKFTYIEGDQKEVADLVEKYKDTKKPLAILANPKKGTTGILLQDVSNHAEALRDTKGVYSVVEEAASPIGGMEELMSHLQTNLTYPAKAREANIQGKVFVQFVVQEDGSVTDVEILKGIGGGCDEEAVRVVASSKWNPGKQKGVAIKQRMSIPIQFSLGESATPNPVSKS
jgi:TonB family protein